MELDSGARLRVRIGGLAAAVAVAVLLALAGANLRQPLFDLFQRVSPARTDDTRVAVVLIDAPSLTAVGGWPWSRYALARLTEQITARGAAAIGFDFLFAEPDRQSPALFADFYPELKGSTAEVQVRALPSMDAVFARVIGRSPVVLARAGVAAGSFDAGTAGKLLPPAAQVSGIPPKALASYPEAVANLPLLDGAALGIGLVNGPPDVDGVTRRVPLVARAAGAITPGFALELVRVAEDAPRIELIGDAHRLRAVKVGRHRLPVDGQGRLALRFGDLPGKAMISAADLLRSGVPSNAFQGKIVLVGLTAAGTSDVVTTPRATETYGVLVQAQAVDAILRGAALQRPEWAALAEGALCLALVAGVVVASTRLRLRAVLGLAVAVAILAFALSWLGFLRGLLLDPIAPLAPAVAAAVAMVGLLFVEGGRIQARLRADIERQRLSAAKLSAELQIASRIQSGMLMSRGELAAVSPAAEVDAVLQPAQTVGGDLYDVFLLEDGRLCMLVGDVTGKGAPAALFMALAKALARSNLMRPGVALDAAMTAIGTELSSVNRESMAVSMLVGLLDPKTGALELCSAGHENPFLVDAIGATRELRLDGGPPLCVVDDFPYPVETHRLGPGETLVAFTDGVTEAQNPIGDLFGRTGLMRAISYLSADHPLEGLIDSLVAAVRAFEAGGEPSDDLTLLALRRR